MWKLLIWLQKILYLPETTRFFHIFFLNFRSMLHIITAKIVPRKHFQIWKLTLWNQSRLKVKNDEITNTSDRFHFTKVQIQIVINVETVLHVRYLAALKILGLNATLSKSTAQIKYYIKFNDVLSQNDTIDNKSHIITVNFS